MAGCDICWLEAQRLQDAGDLRPVPEIYADLVTAEYVDASGLPDALPGHQEEEEHRGEV